MKIRLILALPAVVALALMGASAASASTATATGSSSGHHAGTCRARGDFATCVTSGTATAPRKMYVHVHGNPRQSVFVDWTMTCSKGNGAGSRSGSFTRETPIRHVMRMPYSAPDSCDVSADGSLNGDHGNWIRVNVTYRR
jgi:hypothetical protein